MLPQVTEFDIKLAHLKFVGCVKVKFVKVNNTVRKQNAVENFKCANFMSNSLTCGSTSLCHNVITLNLVAITPDSGAIKEQKNRQCLQ